MTTGWNRWQKIVAFVNNQNGRKWEHGYIQYQRQNLKAVTKFTFSVVSIQWKGLLWLLQLTKY